MTKHELQTCPRCFQAFECQPGNIAHCQCSSVTVSEATREFLAGTLYQGCLCANCLREVNALIEQAQALSFPRHSSELVEGLHYSIEDGAWVFSELYHLLRGNCCGNGCRYCAYGNRPGPV